MIRIKLINEGRVVKQITSRVHEGVVLEQIKKYKDPFDTIQIVEGEFTEGAKDMLHHVARKIIPAAMAAGVAMGGASPAQAGEGGSNPNYPGLNYSVGQHIKDIVSPNYKEMMRQREYSRSTDRQVWNAKQNEIRKQRIAAARAEASGNNGHAKVYDQARNSGDGRFIIIYGMDHRVTRIPAKGTEFMPADTQRLAHYIAPNGQVYYVRHPHTAGIAAAVSRESVKEGYTVTRGIDKERYQERDGLEGPFSTRSGKVVYYDPKEGKYYDPETDFYIGHEDYAKMDESDPNATVGTIPSSGTVGTVGTSGSMSQRTQFAPTGKTTNAKFNKNGQIELDTDPEADGSVNLDADAVKQLQQAGVQIKEGEDSPVVNAIARRIMSQRADLLQKYGPVLVMQAMDDVADFVGDVEEIGSSDVSGWVKHVEQMLQDNPPEAFGEGLAEGTDTLEGILSKYSADYAKFKAGGDIDENPDFFDALYTYYSESGEMPYGVQKARDGDPYEWITDRLDNESGVAPVVEAEEDEPEATPGDQAAADQNIIMQIRKAADYERPTKVNLADGTEGVIAPNIARLLLSKFEGMRPDGKALLQQTLNTQQGFAEILAYFGGGVREQASARVGNIMQSAMAEAGFGRDNRDAYQRDYDHSVAGMGKRQSYAYQQDGGANDEGWDRPEYKAPEYTYYIRFKDTGKVYKQKGVPKSFANKAAANAYALAMIKNNPTLKGNVLLSVDSKDKAV